MPSTLRSQDLRAEIDSQIAVGGSQHAQRLLRELWRTESGPAAAAFVVSRWEQLREQLNLVPYRLSILRSFTVEPMVPLLRASAFALGIDLAVRVCDFNTYAQEILDRESSLYSFASDAVILAVRTADVAPDLWDHFSDISVQDANDAANRVNSSFQQWIEAFRQHSQAALVVHSLEQPLRPATGILDGQANQTSQLRLIQQINQGIRQTAAQFRGVHVLDFDALVARHGRQRWQDDRKWLLARLPIAGEQMIHLVQEWLRFVAPLSGKSAKAIVVDLDNTLWGGVIGEDGLAGIKVGAEYPGAAYQALQRALLNLSRRGILLAIASKNNSEEALEVLDQHPGMLLRSKDFAAFRINWNEKSQSLREIAEELNIGIESLAFLDDNPFEREQVRSAVPEVQVIDVPADPIGYVAAVLDSPWFERLAISDEDRQRNTLYAGQRQRSQSEQSFQTKEDFFRFLEQKAEIAPVSPLTLPRIAQLTQKTNQFNLTTRRYSEQQIADLGGQKEWHIYSLRVEDRFGDHGLVGVAITKDEDKTCEIDTFLLSCRVIGRTVETALLSYVAENAKARGAQQLVGWFVLTKKNAPAREFYEQHGFELLEQNGAGSKWGLVLEQCSLSCPDWIDLKISNGEKN